MHAAESSLSRIRKEREFHGDGFNLEKSEGQSTYKFVFMKSGMRAFIQHDLSLKEVIRACLLIVKGQSKRFSTLLFPKQV